MSTTLNIRIEAETKRQASKILSKMGLDMSTAVKMFLNQVIVEKGLPFIATTDPTKLNVRWDSQIQEALRCGKRYDSASELIDDIL